MKVAASLLPAFLILAVLLFSGCQENPPVSKSDFYLDTVCTVTIYETNTSLSAEEKNRLIDRAFTILGETEEDMSSHLEGSDVARINEASGKKTVSISPRTMEVIRNGLHYSELSGGAFDITIGPLVSAWDIGGENPRIPSQKELQELLPLIDYRKVVIKGDQDSAGGSVFLPQKEMAIDLGGIAKGYAADRTAEMLIESGVSRAIIDYGGNILTIGNRPGDNPWRIGIQDPASERGEYLGILQITEEAVVTSGIYERYFEKDGKRYHHILNPKTGRPARNGLQSVTVVSKKAIEADALSTALFVMGPEKGVEHAAGLQGVEAAFVTTSGKVILTPGLKERFEIKSEDYN
ncbi:MAG: FAD:protein FMN transferase [Spirochaetales bacterium]|nr:FAD:protein FMN transferase [Spirochaetales bacterium]MCF7939469.1 FAD:protein FMN transferase [Spirochaetales bacterium]